MKENVKQTISIILFWNAMALLAAADGIFIALIVSAPIWHPIAWGVLWASYGIICMAFINLFIIAMAKDLFLTKNEKEVLI